MRSPSCSKPVLRKGPWTPEEDLLLSEYIKIHGEGGWTNLPSKAGLLRCGKSCRLRWRNYLRPDVKRGYILPEEEDLILRLHRLLGNRWALIARRIPGRTDNEIKNYWNTHLSKQLIRKGIDPKTHKPFAPESSLQPPLKPPAQKRKKEQLAITDNFIRPPALVDNKNNEAGFFERPINHNLVELDPQSSVTPTYIFHDDPRLAPLYLVNDIGQNDLMVSSNPQQSQALAAHYQMAGLLGPQSSFYHQHQYPNQDFQVQAEDDGRKFKFVENIGMPSLVDCDVECKYVGTLNSLDQFEIQVQPSLQGDDCSAIGFVNAAFPGWPNFSNEVSFFNYGLDMPFLSFQAYQE